MGWVRDQFKNLSEMPQNRTAETPDDRAQRLAAEREVWSRLVSGFQRDVEEFQRLGGSCTLQQPSEIECRILNSSAHITVVVAVDLQAHTVQYSYQVEAAHHGRSRQRGFYLTPLRWRHRNVLIGRTSYLPGGAATDSGAAALSFTADGQTDRLTRTRVQTGTIGPETAHTSHASRAVFGLLPRASTIDLFRRFHSATLDLGSYLLRIFQMVFEHQWSPRQNSSLAGPFRSHFRCGDAATSVL